MPEVTQVRGEEPRPGIRRVLGVRETQQVSDGVGQFAEDHVVRDPGLIRVRTRSDPADLRGVPREDVIDDARRAESRDAARRGREVVGEEDGDGHRLIQVRFGFMPFVQNFQASCWRYP